MFGDIGTKIFAMCLCAAGTLLGTAGAQTTVAIDTNGIKQFDLSRDGLFYWRSHSSCPSTAGDILTNSAYRLTAAPTFRLLRSSNCGTIQHEAPVASDDTWFYYFSGNTLRRIAASASVSSLDQNLSVNTGTDVPVDLAVGTDGKIYFAQRSTGTGAWSIRRCNPDGTNVQPVISGDTSSTFNNEVQQMLPIHYSEGGEEKFVLFYNVGGSLNRLVPGSGLSPQQVASGVIDLDYIRDLPGVGDAIFAARNVLLVKSPEVKGSVGGYLYRINPASGAVTELLYDVTSVIEDVAVDERNYYWVERGSTRSIQRRAHGSTATPTTIRSFADGILDGLKSDGLFVYYRRNASPTGQRVMRDSTDAPAVTLDLIADNVEAVQAIQNLPADQSASQPEVYLVAGKRTIVRGYARIGTNTTGDTAFRTPATLRLRHNGTPIGGFLGYSYIDLDANSGAANTRGDRRASYTFVVPGEYILEGTMQFDFMVNDFGVLPETETLANNTLTNEYLVRDNGRPVLRFWPTAISGLPTHRLGYTNNLAQFMERTKSLVPYADFRVRERDGLLKKLDFNFNPFQLFHEWVPYNMPGDQTNMLVTLSVMSIFDNWLGKTLPVAMIHPNVPDFNGLASPITGSLVRMAGAEGSGYTFPYGGRTLAHEWGHVAFLFHVASGLSCGGQVPEGPYQNFPFDPCTLGPNSPFGYYGYDPITNTVISPDSAADLMSYATNRWVSFWSWYGWDDILSLGQGLDDLRGVAPTGDMLTIVGAYKAESETLTLAKSYILPADMIAPLEETEFPSGGEVRLLDSTGVQLGTATPFDLLPVGEDSGSTSMVIAYVPWNDNTAIAEIVIDGVVRETIVRSANAPGIDLNLRLLYDDVANTLSLNWNMYDDDGDDLVATIRFTNNNGAVWEALVTDYPLDGIVLDTTMLPGGRGIDCRLQLIVTDGMNTAMATSGPVALPLHAPTVHLGGIINGQVFPFGETIRPSGIVMDLEEDSLPTTSYRWEWTGPTSGAHVGDSTIDMENLAPGQYTLRLSATDIHSTTGTGEVGFRVDRVTVPEGPLPELDGVAGGDYSNATGIRVAPGIGTYVDTRLTHSNGNLYVAFTGMALDTGSSYVGLRIDIDDSGDGIAQASDRAFVVSQDGEAGQLIGTGAGSMITDTTPLPGYEARIRRDEFYWSAELKIPDSAIGGWDHAARIALEFTNSSGPKLWPPAANNEAPTTWAPAWFGNTTPVLPPGTPIAIAGADIMEIIDLPTTMALDGSSSQDPSGLALGYLWRQTSGPTVALQGASTAYPTFDIDIPLGEAEYTFELQVTNASSSDTDSVRVRVLPRPLPYVGDLQTVVDRILGRNKKPAEQNRDHRIDSGDILAYRARR